MPIYTVELSNHIAMITFMQNMKTNLRMYRIQIMLFIFRKHHIITISEHLLFIQQAY